MTVFDCFSMVLTVLFCLFVCLFLLVWAGLFYYKFIRFPTTPAYGGDPYDPHDSARSLARTQHTRLPPQLNDTAGWTPWSPSSSGGPHGGCALASGLRWASGSAALVPRWRRGLCTICTDPGSQTLSIFGIFGIFVYFV